MLDERDEFLLSRYPDGDLSVEERARAEELLATSAEAREVLRQYRQLSGVLRLGRETPALDYDAMRETVLVALDARRAGSASHGRDAGTDNQTTDGQTSGDERHALEEQTHAGARRDYAFWQQGVGATVLRLRRSVALAACVLLAAGLCWQITRTANVGELGFIGAIPRSPSAVAPIGGKATDTTLAGTMTVVGPKAEAAPGAAEFTISIGPSPLVANRTAAEIYAEELRARSRPTRIAIDPEVLQASREDGRIPY